MVRKILFILSIMFAMLASVNGVNTVAHANKYYHFNVQRVRKANLDEIRHLNIQQYQLYTKLGHKNNSKHIKNDIHRINTEIHGIKCHLDRPYVY